jgi:hypothetical protein
MPKLPKRLAIKDHQKGIAYIPLGRYISHGFATVSIEDADRLQEYYWHKDTKGYAITGTGRKRAEPNIYMHWLVAGKQQGLIIDHANRDVLDNRRENLRIVTIKQSMQNRRAPERNKHGLPPTSKYKGVCLVTKYKTKVSGEPYIYTYWRYSIYNEGKKYEGQAKTEKEAALEYNKLAKKYHGEYAVLNEVTL